MQRTEAEGVVLSCDFCRRDWDGQEPMVEGHHGSIICLPCLQRALREVSAEPAPAAGGYSCTLCLRSRLPASLPRWFNPTWPEATVCQECIEQAAGVLSKSPLTEWTRDRP